MEHRKIKDALLDCLKYKKSTSREVYRKLAENLKVSKEQLSQCYIDKKGRRYNKFETRVRAVVRELRDDKVLVKGGTRGVWELL